MQRTHLVPGSCPNGVLETGSSLGISLWGSSCNYKIRSLFQKELVTTPYVVSYWKNVVGTLIQIITQNYPTKVFFEKV